MTDYSAYNGTWTIDPSHTRVGFVARHAMVTKVRGAFDDVAGTHRHRRREPERLDRHGRRRSSPR